MANILVQARSILLEALEESAGEIGYRVYEIASAPIDPPAVLIGAPAVEFNGYSIDPNLARFVVFVVAPSNDRVMESLLNLGPRVAAVIDSVRDASVTRMDPGVFPSAGSDLPAYEITAEMSLRRLNNE